jgi:hypothetical protein
MLDEQANSRFRASVIELLIAELFIGKAADVSSSWTNVYD